MKKIGIYCITNVVNNKKYIGYSIDITRRWETHKRDLRNNKHENSHLQHSYNKYGADAFEYSIIEECEQENLKIREKYWIAFYDLKNSGYNMSEGGDGLLNPPEEIGRKISEKLKGENNGMYGVSLTGALNGMYGRKHTDKSKELMSQKARERCRTKSGRHRPVQASTGEIFYVMADAIKWAGLKDISSIGKACRGETKTAGRHPITGERLSWKFRDDLKKSVTTIPDECKGVECLLVRHSKRTAA